MNQIKQNTKYDIAPLNKLKRTKVSAEIDPTASLEECMDMVKTLVTCQGSIQFWLGDLLNGIDQRFGEKFTEAANATGLNIKTLANFCSVCYSVEISRRREILSFEHHREVSRLEPEDQVKWLKIAEDEGLSTRELRESIRHGKIVRVADMANESGRDSGLNVIQGAVMRVKLWEKNVVDAEQIQWTEETVHEVRSDVIKPLEETISKLKAKCEEVMNSI